MAGASLRISTFNQGLVTWGFVGALVVSTILGGIAARAARAVDEIVPAGEIEAKAYDIRTIRPSRSGRVYLYEMGDEGLPADGKIFLLRQGDTPVMALRVLKTYPTSKRIAAKKLRTYSGFETLARNSRYRAFEKVGDAVAPTPPSPEDVKDLQDLESNAIEELPPEAPPEDLPDTQKALEETPSDQSPPEEPPPAEEEAVDDESEDLEFKSDDLSDEGENDNYFPNQFTMAVGLLPSPKDRPPGPTMKFGGGFLYGRNLSPGIALEGGFFYYKSAGIDKFTGNTATTTMIPILGTVRIQRHFGAVWTGYLYGGMVYPWVSSSIGASTKLLQQTQVLRPAFGVGTFLQTGPNWYMRLNLGYDAITVGVMLRY